MANKRISAATKRGMFVRNIGWNLSGQTYAQQNFYHRIA